MKKLTKKTLNEIQKLIKNLGFILITTENEDGIIVNYYSNMNEELVIRILEDSLNWFEFNKENENLLRNNHEKI